MSWVLTEQDLHDLSIGAGILGTGGGGNPYLGYLQVRELLRSGARITVVPASTLADTDLICPVGGIGAPTISIERLPNGGEYLGAMRAVETAWGHPVTHVSSIEIGGANALRPLVVAAQADLPLVDGDGMGRAFPELQMCTFAIADLPITPIALEDVRGNSLLIRQVASARWAEQIARAATVAMGGSAAMALFCLSIDFQNEYLIARDLQTSEALATVPDLICLVHSETGEPLTTEVLRYGYQVAVLAIAAPGPLKSPAGLAIVGPQAFGYSDPYRPLPGDLCAAAAVERTDWTSSESLR
jgi:DUF917 family protein